MMINLTTLQKKVCLMGDVGVGKTSLFRRFVEGRFDDRYLSTIGVKVSRKTLTRPSGQFNLLVWDLTSAAQTVNYLNGAAGALIVCDLTRPDTFASFEKWCQLFRSVRPMGAIVFIANKVDLIEQRAVSEADLQQQCAALGGRYVLTSAKTGIQVEVAFNLLAQEVEAQ